MSDWCEDEPQNLATVLSQFFAKDIKTEDEGDNDAVASAESTQSSDSVEDNSLQNLVNLVNGQKETLHQKNFASSTLHFNQSTYNVNFSLNNQQKMQVLDQKPFGLARETEEMLNSKFFPSNLPYLNKLSDVMQSTQAYNQNIYDAKFNPPVTSVNQNYNLSPGNRPNSRVYNQNDNFGVTFNSSSINGTQKSNERFFTPSTHYNQPLGNVQNSQIYNQSSIYGTPYNPLVNERVSAASTNFNTSLGKRTNSQIYNQNAFGPAFNPSINGTQNTYGQYPHNQHVLYPTMINQVGSYNQDTFSTMLPPISAAQALHNERVFLSNPYLYTSGGFVQNMSDYNQNAHQGTTYYQPTNEPKAVSHQSKRRVLNPIATNKITVGNQFYPINGMPNIPPNNLNLLNERVSTANPYLQSSEIMQNKQIYDQWYNPPVKRTKEMCNQWVQLPTDANPGFNITNQGTLHMQSTFESGMQPVKEEIHSERISSANSFLNQPPEVVQNQQVFNQSSNYETEYNYPLVNERQDTLNEWNQLPKEPLNSNIVQDVTPNNQNIFEPIVKSLDYSNTSNKDTSIYSSQPSEIMENMQINNQNTCPPPAYNSPTYWSQVSDKDSKINKITVDNQSNFQNDPIQETKFLDSRSYPTSTLNYNQSSPDADRKIPGIFELYGSPTSSTKIMDSDKFVTPITNFNQSPLDDTKDFQLNHQNSFETISYPVDYTKPMLNEWVALESPVSNQSLRIIDEETLSNSEFVESMANSMDEQEETNNKEIHPPTSGFYKPSTILEKMLVDNHDIAYKRVENTKETGDDFVSSTSSDSENSIEKGSPISIKSLLKKAPVNNNYNNNNNFDNWDNHCHNCLENTTKISEKKEFCKRCDSALSIRCKKCKKLYKSYKCALKHVCSSTREHHQKKADKTPPNDQLDSQQPNFCQPTTITFLQCKYCSFMTLNERGMKIHMTVKHDNFTKLQNKTQQSEPEKIPDGSPVKETTQDSAVTESTDPKVADLSLPLIDDQSNCEEETKDRSECGSNFRANNNKLLQQAAQSKESTKKYKCKYCPYDGNDASKFINHVSDHDLRLKDSIQSYYEE